MKYSISFLFSFFLFLSAHQSQTFCLQIVEISNDGTDHVIEIQAMGSADFELGTSNLQFGYNTTAVNTPVFDSSPFAPPFYQVPTVTTPGVGQASFNIELAFATFGTTISSTTWTPLGRISFSIVDATQTTNYLWSYNGGTTQTVVFLDDEATQIFAANTTNFCLIALDAVLPLELLNFAARPKNNQTIQLEWTSLNEQNFLGFEVERSLNSRDFSKIDFVKGKSTHQAEQSYVLADQNVSTNQTYYYRLKMVDMDGSHTYSEIRQAKLNGFGKFNIFPNPTHEKIIIDWNEIPHNGETQISLTNAAQQVLAIYNLSDFNQQSQFEMNLSNYPSGIYYLRIQLDGFTQWERIVVQ